MTYDPGRIKDQIQTLWPNAVWTSGYEELWDEVFKDRNTDWMIEAIKLLRTLPAGKTYGKNPPEICDVEKAWWTVCDTKKDRTADERYDAKLAEWQEIVANVERDRQDRLAYLEAIPKDHLRDYLEEFEHIRHRYGLKRPKLMTPSSWGFLYAGFFYCFVTEKREQELATTH